MDPFFVRFGVALVILLGLPVSILFGQNFQQDWQQVSQALTARDPLILRMSYEAYAGYSDEMHQKTEFVYLQKRGTTTFIRHLNGLLLLQDSSHLVVVDPNVRNVIVQNASVAQPFSFLSLAQLSAEQTDSVLGAQGMSVEYTQVSDSVKRYGISMAVGPYSKIEFLLNPAAGTLVETVLYLSDEVTYDPALPPSKPKIRIRYKYYADQNTTEVPYKGIPDVIAISGSNYSLTPAYSSFKLHNFTN